jgi:AraC-like DNA-binding protein/transposase
MSDVFWLSDAQAARLEAYFPKSHGKSRVDDRRVLNGIIFINRNGLRRRGTPKVYGLHKSLYNVWKRWSDKDIFGRTLAGFAYRIANGNIWPRRQDAEFSLASVTRVISDNFASQFTPLEVHFEHPAPEYPQPLERLFRAPVRYLQPINHLIIARPDALRLIRHEDQGLLATLERQVRDLIGEATPVLDTTSAARAVIDANLGISAITLDRVAAVLHLGPRTLQRRLAAEGTSLLALLDEVRHARAVRLLSQPGARVGLVAQALGHIDPTAFRRAWRGWTGKAPSNLRRN